MRSNITVQGWVKVTNPSLNHQGNTEMAEKLGAQPDLLNIKSPVTGTPGQVLGMEDGFVLVDFDSYQYLMDIDGVESITDPNKVSILVRYMKNNTLEEFETMEMVNKRLVELMKSGSLTLSDDIKIYEVAKVHKAKLSLEIFLG